MNEPFTINWLDLAIVLVIVGSTSISLLRGFGREILSLINFFVAFLVARYFSPQFAGLLSDSIQQPAIRAIVAYGGLFAMSILVGGLIMRAVSMLIKFGGLELIDRLLGTVFGFARGLIIIVVVIGISNWGGFFNNTPTWRNSWLVPYVLPIEEWSRGLVRVWLFERDEDGLADSLPWQLNAIQNENRMHEQYSNPDDIRDMLGPRR